MANHPIMEIIFIYNNKKEIKLVKKFPKLTLTFTKKLRVFSSKISLPFTQKNSLINNKEYYYYLFEILAYGVEIEQNWPFKELKMKAIINNKIKV